MYALAVFQKRILGIRYMNKQMSTFELLAVTTAGPFIRTARERPTSKLPQPDMTPNELLTFLTPR